MSLIVQERTVRAMSSATASPVPEPAKAIYTGTVGDGKIFIYDVANAFRIRTGQSGADAVSS